MVSRSFLCTLSALLLTVCVSCSSSSSSSSSLPPGPSEGGTAANPSAAGEGSNVIRMTGSDTMVNLAQAWAETYAKKHPDVSIQVAGGGSGVGIAGLIDNVVDIATSSRQMSEKEIGKAKTSGGEPKEFIVGQDALAVYVHKDNPMEAISIEELAEIYGDGGKTEKWSDLGVDNKACDAGKIVRVSRQNNSGTYVYFRETVVGEKRDFKDGSIDQNGSKDVVTLVGKTGCAIGYSGMAYATPDVKMLKISKKKGEAAIAPTVENAANHTYPISRPLFLYTRGEPKGVVKEFIDWCLAEEGQKVVADIGYVPNSPAGK